MRSEPANPALPAHLGVLPIRSKRGYIIEVAGDRSGTVAGSSAYAENVVSKVVKFILGFSVRSRY